MTRNTDRYQVAKRTTYVSAMMNTLLAILKIIVGWIGHSSALIADGIHSLSDLSSDALVLIASKIGTKHPDEGHPYGHQRVETVATIVIAFLFLGAGIFIIYDAATHLLIQKNLQQPSLTAMIIAAVAVVTNEWLFRYNLKNGELIHSNLLIANAWHKRSDAYISVIVLISIGFAFFGLPYFDAIGAALVALLIVKIGVKMVWESINELLDAAVDEKTLDKIRHAIQTTPGVTAIHQLRTRLHGGSIFVDVHIQVSPTISVSEGHYISEQVHLRLLNQFKKISDVTVHTDPENDETARPSVNLPTRIELEKKLKLHWENLPGYSEIKKLQLHYLNGQLELEIILPLLLLDSISAKELEQQYKNACKEITDIKKIRMYFA